ncbi:alpha/beta fold hydrolase [Phytomonospora sp. NPDC050363]|uniref:alpha/beta hydrolase family protein n=1 Tax=Phytomonospora sp. NPDC050363 TaxID=3155642 RepID=UPI0033EE3394
MTDFLDLDGIHTGFVAANRSRAIAAGVDPYEYDRVTAGIGHIREWPDAFIAAARERSALGERGSTASREEAARAAALLFHFATVLPDSDERRRTRAATSAAEALARALPSAVAVADDHPEEGFRGYLRLPPAEAPPLVILVPGMNSSAVEFAGVSDVLLRRGLAVLAIDGPGQGACPGRWQPKFERVVGRAIDALPGFGPVGIWAMSMGGWLGARATAHEPRVRALVAVSGPGQLRWEEFVPYVSQTFVRRTGGEPAARGFAAGVDLAAVSARMDRPARIVEGGLDVIPGVSSLAGLPGELVLIEDGGHLVEEHRHLWLPQAADWLAQTLQSTPAAQSSTPRQPTSG